MAKRLKNWEYAKIRGRQSRLEAELNAHQTGAPVPSSPPLFSHDATIQSNFNKAWNEVLDCDVTLFLRTAKTSQGVDLVSKIRNFRECHFH
ncbi:TPA: hypothetical protein ACK21Z_003175 [Vibrio harveyi]|uniref:hypothetical protein n=1 Tax=Vibrio harveyi TaxID=669 RepID=UPI0028B50A94|nr:hypothetical protein [Vibrio harveyi]HDZ3734284.1 hypothetical protein [Vibrio harveyi]